MCNKAPYANRREAQSYARNYAHSGRQQRPYRCHVCGAWHLHTCRSRGKRAQWRQEKQSRKAQKQQWYCLLWNEEE